MNIVYESQVNYEGTKVQNKCIEKVLMEKRDKVYAIPNTGGIIVDDEKIIFLGDTQLFSK